jgi:hypothetical protein
MVPPSTPTKTTAVITDTLTQIGIRLVHRRFAIGFCSSVADWGAVVVVIGSSSLTRCETRVARVGLGMAWHRADGLS